MLNFAEIKVCVVTNSGFAVHSKHGADNSISQFKKCLCVH